MRRLYRLSCVGFVLVLAVTACSERPSASKPVTAKAPVDSYELRLGKGLYSHYCQTCHGETGAGDGFNAFNLDPRPRDLSNPVSQKKSDAELAAEISALEAPFSSPTDRSSPGARRASRRRARRSSGRAGSRGRHTRDAPRCRCARSGDTDRRALRGERSSRAGPP